MPPQRPSSVRRRPYHSILRAGVDFISRGGVRQREHRHLPLEFCMLWVIANCRFDDSAGIERNPVGVTVTVTGELACWVDLDLAVASPCSNAYMTEYLMLLKRLSLPMLLGIFARRDRVLLRGLSVSCICPSLTLNTSPRIAQRSTSLRHYMSYMTPPPESLQTELDQISAELGRERQVRICSPCWTIDDAKA